ncbi:hypothetical protein AB205_0218340 [Aquarana catesbeiana]|uniref:Uncharacterized protein n=1 Tax=Aquarana catesbeiana TaxID=8400 RepID=A0A2G9S0J0_AQUCT|nr:hypothetical protein AB205_0218340 [Aquarana catesbeiana]
MFHIPISGLKYRCAKYTFCFIFIGEKRLRTSEDTIYPHLLKRGNRGHHNQRMWRKGRWLKLSPQQVMCMLWKNNLLISRVTVHKGYSRT